ncbi:hypothetical+protein [Methylocapsa aurea]
MDHHHDSLFGRKPRPLLRLSLRFVGGALLLGILTWSK